MRTRSSVFIAALLFGLLASTVARADGFIIIVPPEPPPLPGPWLPPRPIPPPPPRPVFFPLSVKFHRVSVEIAGAIATTEIDQAFSNPNPADLEGTYLFPLPADASISKFSLFMNGKEVEAELLDAGKAREIYERIVRQMRDPALLEYAGRGLFKARIYPIPARGEARVKLTYQQVLGAEGGLREYRYPLSTEKWSAAPLEDVWVEVNLRPAPGAAVGNIFSPSHAVSIERTAGGGARATYQARLTTPDRDFVLYYQSAERERDLDVSVLTHRPGGEDGTFLMLLAPPPSLGEGEAMPKDVVFVIDTSGSMAGEKMEQAKAALRYCLPSLERKDRFAVIDFATEVRALKDALVEASPDAIAAALVYVDAMKARGGTDIHGALRSALELPAGGGAAEAGGLGGRPFLIVFMTDGEPTIGVTVPADIEKAVKAAREARADSRSVRLFVFGVGTDVNAGLLDRLAEANRGAREYVAPGESIELKVSRFFDKVASPVFSDVEIAIPGLGAYDIYPRPLPDLFRGGEIAIVGRYRTPGEYSVHLKGLLNGHALELLTKLSFPARSEAAFLPRVFAVRKVAYLLDQIRLHGESEELKREVVRLAKEFGIVTPYTSYLVIEDERRLASARPGGERGAAADAIESLRRDGEFARLEREAGKTLAGPARAPASEADRQRALGASEAARKLAEAPLPAQTAPGADLAGAAESMGRFGVGGGGSRGGETLPAPGLARPGEARARLEEVVRVIEGRTFYRQGEIWVDARYVPGTALRRVAYLSEGYFRLVAERPALGKFLALGPRVRVVEGGEAIEVGPEGGE